MLLHAFTFTLSVYSIVRIVAENNKRKKKEEIRNEYKKNMNK